MNTLDYVSAGLEAGSLVLTAAGVVAYNSGAVLVTSSELAEEGIEMVDLANAVADGGETLEALLASTRTGLQAAEDAAEANELGIAEEGIELQEITEETELLAETAAEAAAEAATEAAAEAAAEAALEIGATAAAELVSGAVAEGAVMTAGVALAGETFGTSLIVAGMTAGAIAGGVEIYNHADDIADGISTAGNAVSQEFDKDAKKVGKALNPANWF